MSIIPRSYWGATLPKGSVPLPISHLSGITVHWFGSPKAAISHVYCAPLLRSVQRFHMENNGWHDIAYNHAACPHGYVYELRGFGVRSAANGTNTGNATHAAIVYMAGVGDAFTDGGKAGLNFLIEDYRRRGAGKEVSPHRRWTGSTCPGDTIISWLNAGRPEPTPREEVEIVEAWVPVFIDWYLFGRPAGKPRPASAPPAIPARVWQVVDLASRYRQEKPDGSADVAALQAKIAAAIAALQ